MTEFLLTLPILVLAALLYLERRDRREAERDWAAERGALLQRIQAPEIAVRQFATDPLEDLPEPVSLDMGPWTVGD